MHGNTNAHHVLHGLVLRVQPREPARAVGPHPEVALQRLARLPLVELGRAEEAEEEGGVGADGGQLGLGGQPGAEVGEGTDADLNSRTNMKSISITK